MVLYKPQEEDNAFVFPGKLTFYFGCNSNRNWYRKVTCNESQPAERAPNKLSK